MGGATEMAGKPENRAGRLLWRRQGRRSDFVLAAPHFAVVEHVLKLIDVDFFQR
jgi:hypothetical protein